MFLFLSPEFSEAIFALRNMGLGISPTNLNLRNQMKQFTLQSSSTLLHYHKRSHDSCQGL